MQAHMGQTTNQRAAERMELDTGTVLNKAPKLSSEKFSGLLTTRLLPAAFVACPCGAPEVAEVASREKTTPFTHSQL